MNTKRSQINISTLNKPIHVNVCDNKTRGAAMRVLENSINILFNAKCRCS
ncbi:hypothetical protein HanPSC8_Chr01g0003011 [Helianthus annuus]|nr:hypothetical protein HanPSC8_Chr01g0003011 [Helianthus annuus]